MDTKTNTTNNDFDVIVIGGGAAGLMAAGRAAELGKRVLLLEKNPKLGEKLKISGGGRCNITNAELDVRALLPHYGAGEQFLYSAFAEFGVKDTFAFFEKLGLPLIVEAGKRAFPHTEKALDVYLALEKYIKQGHVTIKTSSPVTKITKEGTRITEVCVGKTTYTATSYIFSTGGLSHPETGSTGDGFKWLRDLGHNIATPTPSIVPLLLKETWSKKLSGVSLDPMRITFFVNGEKKLTKLGKVLFTHFGLSGPLILNSAQKVSDLLHVGTVTAEIDIFPNSDIGALDKTLVSVFEKNKNKQFKTTLKEIVPNGMLAGILALTEKIIPDDTKVHSIEKEDRKDLVQLLKSLPLTITGLMGYDKAVVADGGVNLTEIDTRTMRSKKIDNLYITGDLLHINRPSGGYSLQLCWTTGYVAGSNAS